MLQLREPNMERFLKSAKMLAIVLTGAISAAVVGVDPSMALDDPPAKPKIDCSKKANKTKPQCQKGYSDMTDTELYNAAYWLARQGAHSEALTLLTNIQDKDQPRVLNATGYATRKLGNVDAALPFYARALALDPNYTKAREYLGEAYLAQGNLVQAQVQLREIETRCGTACSGYAELASEISAFEGQRARGG
jgi:tetratricopeptide (TPR) repeat protein